MGPEQPQLAASFHGMSRRSVLKLAAAAALPVLSRPVTGAQNEKKTSQSKVTGPIDAHVHVWTPDVTRYPLAEGGNPAEMKPASFTPEELFAQCKPVGVNRIVLIQMSFYKTDNRYMLDTIRKYPDNFRGVAIIDETRPDAARTMQELKEAGVTGYRLYANKAAVESWATAPEMNAMWAQAQKLNQAICLLSNPDALPGIQVLCERHPQTRVVIDHFSRIGVSGKVEETDLANLCRLADYPNVFVKTSAFYALGKKKAPYTDLGPMIRQLRDTFGAQRLMWASDCPFQVENGHTYKASIDLIRDKLDFLTEEDKSWILEKTAEQVYWQV